MGLGGGVTEVAFAMRQVGMVEAFSLGDNDNGDEEEVTMAMLPHLRPHHPLHHRTHTLPPLFFPERPRHWGSSS